MGGLVLAVIAVVVALVLRSDSDRFDSVRVGRSPDGVAVARSVVWVASRDGTLTRIESGQPSSRRIPVRIGRNLDSVTIGGGSVWVTGEADGKVARLNQRSGRVEARILVGGQPKGLAVGGGFVWVANCLDGTVVRIPLDTGSLPSPIRVGGRPRSVAVARGRVYVAVRPGYGGCGGRAPGAVGHIATLDTSGTQEPRSLVRVGDPTDIAVTRDWLWVADHSRNEVLRVDPVTGSIEGDAVAVDSELTAIAADEDGVWALSRNETTHVGKVTRIDPETLDKVGKSIDVDGHPQEIAIETGRVWVTQADADQVTPIKR
jgi:DNA-binding beta-propeller fold protein YncE